MRIPRGFTARFAAVAMGVSVVAPAQQTAVPAKEKTGFEAIRESDLRANLGFVSSTGMQGRLSLRPGDDAAVEWVASEFAKAGLKPIGADADGKSSYFQLIPMVEYVPDRTAALLTLTRNGAKKEWKAPQFNGAFREDVDVTAGVVFAGFGITAPELGYDDYAGVDAKGKVVLILDHEPQEDDEKSVFNGKGNTRYATARVKALNAQKHGALAVMVMAEPNRKHLSNAERAGRIAVGSAARREGALPVQALAEDELKIPTVQITDPVANELLATAGKSPKELQTGIDTTLKSQSVVLPQTEVTLHLHNTSRTMGVARNAVGLLEGSDATLKNETLLVSGHHDHDGAFKMSDGSFGVWQGADDNGSGTVGVVELAHAFADNPVKPKRSILFAVFAAEERGLLGSYWLAQKPLRPLATLRAQVNFDMIGRNEEASAQTDGLIEIPKDTTNRMNLVGSLYSPDMLKVVEAENKHVGLTLDDRFEHDSALNIFFRSDQFPFVLKDIPAFWFFTGFHPDYHHVTDTPDKINYVKMTKILKLAYLTLFELGDEAGHPKFVGNPAQGK